MSWSGTESLPLGHTVIGLLEDGREIDIYRVSADQAWDVTTAMPVGYSAGGVLVFILPFLTRLKSFLNVLHKVSRD